MEKQIKNILNIITFKKRYPLYLKLIFYINRLFFDLNKYY
jgi:hypothetical protein